VTGANNGGSIYLGLGGTNPTAAIESSWGGATWPQLGIGVIRDALTANILMDYGSNTQIRRGTTTTMFLTGNGKAGIGTTDPASTLHVSGAGLIGSTASGATNVSLNSGGPASNRSLNVYYQSGGTVGSATGDYSVIQSGNGGVANT